MNVFFLDKDPRVAAQYHCDKHVVKMILEYAQLLSTAHRMLDGDETTIIQNGRKKKVFKHPDPIMDAELYGVTHRNHPSAVWVREHANNYNWVAMCMMHLNYEYKQRYGHTKNHKTIDTIGGHLLKLPTALYVQDKVEGLVPPPQCVADDCKTENTVLAYRKYYMFHKADIAKWKLGDIPSWFTPPNVHPNQMQETFGRLAVPVKVAKPKKLLKPEVADVKVMLDEADDWLRQHDPEYA